MPCHTRMKTINLKGLIWLYLLGFSCMVLSLEPGYLDFDNLPDTNFSCVGKVIGGYYADLETNCQMFHVCTIGQLDEPMDIRFLCLNGTVFDQETRVCERIDEVDCSKSEQFYSLNLELYGNTQPSLVEDNIETDPPIIIKPATTSTTTTTTTTTTQRPKPKTTRTVYFTTTAPTVTVTKVISAHHFPISSRPDIRFNPEEINISLNPGAPASIRPKPTFPHNNQNNKNIVTTHTSYSDEEEDFVKIRPNTQKPLSSTPRIPPTPGDINYAFTYHPKKTQGYQNTERSHNYQYHHSNIPGLHHGQFRDQFKTSTYRTEHVSSTRRSQQTTFRTPYVSSLKPPSYDHYGTETPQRLQLPLPLLPTLPPLTFSSPAPFSLRSHIETKRYTNNHQPPPRIIISASASVSDNSGRRLNYSLGTIGVTPVLEEPTRNYDDYKDHDVILDPFYHDVPKLKSKRRKRQIKPSEVIKSEQEAVDVLRFLFDWYKNQEKSSTIAVPISPSIITEINQELAPVADAPVEEITNKTEENEFNFRESNLFKRKSKFNIVGDVLSVTEKQETEETTPAEPAPEAEQDIDDYVDDNYEAEYEEIVDDNYDSNKNDTDLEYEYEDTIETADMNDTNSAKDEITTTEEITEALTTTTTEVPTTSTTEVPTTSTTEIPTTTTTTTKNPKTWRRTGKRVPTRPRNNEALDVQRKKYLSLFHAPKLNLRSRPISKSTTTTEPVTVETTTVKPVTTTETTDEIPTTTETDLEEITTTTLEASTIEENIEEETIVGISKAAATEPYVEYDYESLEETTINPQNLETTTDEIGSTEEQETESELKEEDSEHSSTDAEIDIKPNATKITKENFKEGDFIESVTKKRNIESKKEKLFKEVSKHSDEDRKIKKLKILNLSEDTTERIYEEEITTIAEDLAQTVIEENTTTIPDLDNEEEEENVENNKIYTEKELIENLASTTETFTISETVDALSTSTTPSYEETSTATFATILTEPTIETTTPGLFSSTTETEELQPTNLTPAETTTTPTRPRPRLKTAHNFPRHRSYPKPNHRHRFSTEHVSKPSRGKPVTEKEIVDVLPSQLNTTEISSTSTQIEEIPATDAPLSKSANPTQAEAAKIALHTTPISMIYKLHIRKEKLKYYVFNCFGKPINQFYSDPRDCRLFHYCTSGYTKNQLLDMKFVCDLGTYFDDENLICTKIKPERCL